MKRYLPFFFWTSSNPRPLVAAVACRQRRVPVTVQEPSTVARSRVIKRTWSIDTVAWKALPMSAFAELSAVLLFGLNLAMSLTTQIPPWFGRKQVNERMSIYWLVTSYPATRRLLVEHDLITLAAVENIPKTLLLPRSLRK
jgi:hypothetical protein